MKGECTCWREYPNEARRRSNGKWICVDKYECVRQLQVGEVGDTGVFMPRKKTLCRKKQEEGRNERG